MTARLEGKFATYVRQPDYAARMGYLAEVERDVASVFRLLVDEKNPVVVFVDDLDRCSPGKVAEVIEAINLFMSGELPDCYFVIGMDAAVVAASMEVAHTSLTARLQSSARAYGSLGWHFMEKFVQLAFVIPSLSDPRRKEFLSALVVAPQPPAPTPDAREAERHLAEFNRSNVSASEVIRVLAADLTRLQHTEPASTQGFAERVLEEGAKRFKDDDQEVQGQLIRFAPYLGATPRAIKRFVNLYRFYRFTQWSCELQGLPSAPPTVLGRWLVLMLRWPVIVRWIQWGGEPVVMPHASPQEKAVVLDDLVQRVGTFSDWPDAVKKVGLEAMVDTADRPLFDLLKETAAPGASLRRALEVGLW